MRDWRRLPYWQSTVSVARSVEELHRLLDRYGVTAVRQTTSRDPWRLLLEWQMEIRGVPVIVAFDITVTDEELAGYTVKQREAIPAQAARLVVHTVKNLLAAADAGLVSMEEVFLSRVQTYQAGQPVSVGDLVLDQIERAGQLGPAIVQRALPKPGDEA